MSDPGPAPSESVQVDEGPLRHQELYIEGDFVVLALGPRPILLRVPRSTLTTHSEIFRDMFSLPESNDGVGTEGTTDQNPISLPDDPEAFIFVLKLYHHSILRPPITLPNFTTVVGALRVSSKYQFTEAQEWGREFLRNSWSLTSTSWQGHLSLPRPTHSSSVRDALAQNALELIGVSRETGIDEFLPAAFYYLCIFGDVECAPTSNAVLSHRDLFALLKGARTLIRSWGVWISNKKCTSIEAATTQSMSPKKVRKQGRHYCSYCGAYHFPEGDNETPEEAPIPPVNEEQEWKQFVLSDATIKSVLSSMEL